MEARLHALDGLSRDEILALCDEREGSNPNFLPSECLVHLVRACRRDNSERWFERLYKSLIARVLRALPRSESSDGGTSSYTRESIRDKVCARFVEMLAADRTTYEERLDFFEVRFDMAMKRLRMDAQKQAWRDENRNQSIEYDEESGEMDPVVEAAAGSYNPLAGEIFRNEAFRLRLDAAIEALPIEQSRTVRMLMLDYQIHSEDPTVNTICKVLAKTPKTIWNYRQRAFEALRKTLADGDAE